MSLESTNPEYDEYIEDWATMRDLYKGERVVKQRGEQYLPATQGMRLDGLEKGKEGYSAYQAYKMRAILHDYVKDGVEMLIGLLHQKDATIELPAAMEPMRERATINGESLLDLLRRINEEQLVPGRLGLLADFPTTTDQAATPYLALYTAESAGNWDDAGNAEGFSALNLVVLNETGFVRNGSFDWEIQERYRVLQLGQIDINEPDGGAVYKQGVFLDKDFNESSMIEPTFKGATLDKIPFVFINSKDIVAHPDEPPLMGLGRLVLAIYRGEADYRQNLYMQGQDTLVTIGSTQASRNSVDGDDADTLRTGAGSRITLEQGGDAKYIGVNSQGLAEQRMALDTDKKRAETKAGQLVNGAASKQESGDALRTRMAAQTATLNQIALAGAAGLQHVLRIVAEWMGANPEEVVVTPNVEFADFDLSGQEIVYLMTAKGMGAPISNESIHNLMVERGITKLDYDAELELIAKEEAAPEGTGAGGTDPLIIPPQDNNNG